MSTSNAVDLKPDTISSTKLGANLNLVTVPPSQSQYSVGQLSSLIHDIGSHIIFNQKLSALGLQYFERFGVHFPCLCYITIRSVPLAIKRAIEEVMNHVVQHNVTIATQTTKDLVLKDAFCASVLNHLRSTLQASNISSELQVQAVAIIMNDNLDLCCAVIQHATIDNFHLLIVVPATVPVSSTDSLGVGVSRTYVSSAGKLSRGLSSYGMESLGSGSIAQLVDRISEEVDPSSARLLSGSARNVATDGTIQSRVEVSNAALNSSPAIVLEQLVLETSNAMKKLGGTLPPFLAISTVERTTGEIFESLLTIGDALEKYQIVALKLKTLVTEDNGETEIQGVIAQVSEIILRCIRRDEAVPAVAQKKNICKYR
ncbi:hypothetical protein RHSIM_Rhsim03G0123200 [Rhododendron simsii]|uniref:CCR4-NOT transcription complex subunit 1 domain-containing protein n=1 Tax=Rhododendron simsii TaxID=118357 RepID=A0A834LPZ0_RHOSS|nr:hypothetical protein RHSIM_Rhsim03G0123200 [Rhododendron simsii]